MELSNKYAYEGEFSKAGNKSEVFGVMKYAADPKEDLEFLHSSLNNSTDETRCFTDGHLLTTNLTHRRVYLKTEENNRVKTENCTGTYTSRHVSDNHARMNSLANLPYDTNLSFGFFQNKPSFASKKEKEIHHVRNKPLFTSLPEGVSRQAVDFQKDYKQRKPLELSVSSIIIWTEP